MTRRNIFHILDDYLANPTNKRIINEISSLSGELITEAKVKYLAAQGKDINKINDVETDAYIPFLEKIILEDAKKANHSSDRLIQSNIKESKEGETIDAAFVYQVTDTEKNRIDHLINAIKDKGKSDPFGLNTVYFLTIERRKDSEYQYLQDDEANNSNKLVLLKQECQKYSTHLESVITKLAKKMPPEVVAHFQQVGSSKIDIKKLIREKTAGHSFIWSTDKSYSGVHSNKQFPSLYAALDKYIIVNQMLDDLNKSGMASNEKLEQFQRSLSTYKDELAEHRDGAVMKFIKNVLHILSAGVASKLTKESFQFWKSHGEVFADKAEDIESTEGAVNRPPR